MLPFRHHRRSFVKIFFLISELRSQTKKNFSSKPPLLPPFQHLILHFGRMINTCVSKNKKLIPYQYNISLKQPPCAHIELFNYVFSCYFLAFCLLEEIYLVVHGDRIILFLLLFIVIAMLN